METRYFKNKHMSGAGGVANYNNHNAILKLRVSPKHLAMLSQS